MTGRPPLLAQLLVRAIVPRAMRGDLLDDLRERFAELIEDRGELYARAWYWRQALKSLRPWVSTVLDGIRKKRTASARSYGRNWVPGGHWYGDFRTALRAIWRVPGYSSVVIGVLALGIAGTTAVFSVLSGILIRPLPYQNSEELAVLWTVNTQQNLPDGTSALNLADWKMRTRSFSDLAAYFRPRFTTSTVAGIDVPERVHVGLVSANFFRVIGVEAILGRSLADSDIETEARVAVLEEGYWRQRYGGSPAVLGQSIRIDGSDFEIVGVMPASLQLPLPETRIWTLYDVRPGDVPPSARASDVLVVLGRRNPGVGVADAQREMSQIAARLAAEYPETNASLGVSVRTLRAEITGDRLPGALWFLFAAAVMVLLIAATNVAHLTLARGLQRQRELAVRIAMGASRARLIRQLLIESWTLSLVAGLAGILLGTLMMRGLIMIAPVDLPRLEYVSIDLRVLGLAVVLALLVGPVFGLFPALSASRAHPAVALHNGARGASATHRSLRSGLVVAEVALAVVLLAEAGLMIRSVAEIGDLDPGFDAGSVLVAQIDIDGVVHPRPQRSDLFQSVLERVRALPGVERAGFVSDFFIHRFPDQRIVVEGKPRPEPGDPQPRLTTDVVLPGFFDAIGVRLLEGRDLEAADIAEGAEQVAVINRAMAEAFWPSESPIGGRYTSARALEPTYTTVVGVVDNMRRSDLEEAPYPQAFIGSTLRYFTSLDLAVRTAGDPMGITPTLESLVHQLDPTAAISNVGIAWTHLGDTMAERKLQSWLLVVFSALATGIAAIGIYALLHNLVVSRRRELGIRMALGAEPGLLRATVIREGMLLVVIGLSVGLAGILVVSRVTSGMLYDTVAPTDPLTLGSVVALLGAVGVAASWLPAHRATTVAPRETLARED